jgi:hypothetical protein
MSMIKIITPDAQDFSAPVASLIKISRQGLRGVDLAAFEKRAGAITAHEIAKLAKDLREDEPLIHMLAIGATGAFGPNRNGDGFTAEVCKRQHPTFVKHARFFRDHQNKNKAKSYGLVKWSGFHDPMKRIELVVALNGSKEAAERNNGLVADKELEKLARGKPISVSMACLVSHDICSYCGNKAPKRADYCVGTDQGGQCKAGGLRDNIGSLVEIDGGIHHLHADNPDPTFFDISHVYRPADRIAYVTGLLKAAGDHVIGGAELAEVMGVTLPSELLLPAGQPAAVEPLFKLAMELAALEAQVAARRDLTGYVGAFSPDVQELPALPSQCREKAGQFLMALADNRCLLPMATFLELFANQPREKAAMIAESVRQQLPGVYSRLLEQPDLPNRLATLAYQPAPASGAAFRLWAAKQASALSVQPAAARARAMRAAVRDIVPSLDTTYEKRAADAGVAGMLAEEYALYKLAFLGALTAPDDEMQLTAAITLLQNYVM